MTVRMFGRSTRILMGLILSCLLLQMPNAEPARATSAATWQTPFIIQNIDQVQAQDVQVQFISLATGSVVYTLDLGPLAPGRSIPVRPYTIGGLPPGDYSVVISSDAMVTAVVNQVSGSMGDAYVGATSFNLTGSSVTFPNVVRNYANWNSPLYIQNANSSPTTVIVRFYRFSDGAQVAEIQQSLAPGQSFAVDPASVSGLSDGTQYSVVATSSGGPLTGVVNQMQGGSLLMSYSGFSGGGLQAFLPNVTRNYAGPTSTSGWNTPFIVQNTSLTTPTNVTARYYRFSDGALVATDGPYTLGPGLSHPFRPWITNGLADNTQYSVVVQSDSQPIVAVVNETYPGADAMAYEGVGPPG